MRALLAVLMLSLGIGRTAAEPLLDELPLHITEPSGSARGLVIFWSGDAGWTGNMQGLADAFALRGFGVVGVSSLRYFWRERTPAAMAADIDHLITHFRQRWRAETTVLLGLSFGADMLPFAWPLMDEAERQQTDLIALLSPFPKTEFRVSFRGMLGIVHGPHDVMAAIAALPADRVVCILGERERDMACSPDGHYRFHTVPGGHRYTDLDLVADLVTGAL